MKLGKYTITLGLLVLLMALSFFVMKKRNEDSDQTNVSSKENNQKITINDRAESPKPVVQIKEKQNLKPGEVRLRFDPSKHPFSSKEAADFYYSEYKKLLFPDVSAPSSWFGQILEDVEDGNNLHLALGLVEERELIEATPLLLGLLKNSNDVNIKRKSAKILTQFGKDEGIKFLLNNYDDNDLAPQKLLHDLITQYGLANHLPEIKNLLTKEQTKGGAYGYYPARILAHFGDVNSLDYYLPNLEKKINFDDKDLVLLGNIKDKRLIEPLQRQFDQSTKAWAKVAAAYALSKQIGGEYENFVVDKALASLEMPNARKEPEKYQEWRQKNGGNSGTGVSQAVSYLPKLGTEKAVSALEKISEARNNYSKNAIIGLAKIGTRASRDALVRLAQKEQARESSEGIYLGSYLAKGLSLYNDPEANALASSLFKWEKGKNLSFFLAETKGSKGLFDERIKRW